MVCQRWTGTHGPAKTNGQPDQHILQTVRSKSMRKSELSRNCIPRNDVQYKNFEKKISSKIDILNFLHTASATTALTSKAKYTNFARRTLKTDAKFGFLMQFVLKKTHPRINLGTKIFDQKIDLGRQ